MKTIVSVQEISEFDLKPVDSVIQWKSLVDTEIRNRWKDKSSWSRIKWPTCSPENEKFAFEHQGFNYQESLICGSLFASYRPNEDEIWSWYRDSPPSKFWRNNLLAISSYDRQEKINEPRSDWIMDRITEYIPSATTLIDISVNGRALIDLVVSKNSNLKKITMAGMTADLDGVNTKIVTVAPTKVLALPNHGLVDIIVAIDIFDRVANLSQLIDSMNKTLAPGGIAFITTPVSSGFEMQTLWEDSPSILPPDKINIPSINCLKLIFSNDEWEILELSTPGMFDVELVKKTMILKSSKSWPRITRSLVTGLGLSGQIALIEMLQSQCLTSFARLVIKKKYNAS